MAEDRPAQVPPPGMWANRHVPPALDKRRDLEFTSLSLPSNRINRELLWFAAAGTIGFVVDTSILYLLQGLGIRFGLARIASFLAAVLTTWIMNRSLTFRVHAPMTTTEFFKYLGAMSAGGLINYGVSLLVVTHYPIGRATGALAVAAGSLSGLLVNYLSSKLWVFARQKRGSPDSD